MFLVSPARGQLAWEVMGAQAKLEFVVVSSYLHGAEAQRISRLGNVIDLNKYPDAEVMIRVYADKLRGEQNFRICSTCYRSSLPGLTYVEKGNTPLRDTDSYAYVRYRVSDLSSPVSGELKLTLWYGVKNYAVTEKHFSAAYTIIPQREEEIAEPVAAEEVDFVPKGPSQPASVDPVSDRRAAADRFWQDNDLSGDRLFEQNKDDISQLRRLRDAYYEYSREYQGLFPDRDRHATAAVDQIVERTKFLIGARQPAADTVQTTTAAPQPAKQRERPRPVALRQRPLSVAFTELGNGGVAIEATGGQPPYSVQLYDTSGTTHLLTLADLAWQKTTGNGQAVELAATPNPALLRQLAATTYTVRVLDSNGNNSDTSARYALNPPFWQKYGPWLALAAILLGTPLLFVLINLSQKDFGA
jgi:hypothetical protein